MDLSKRSRITMNMNEDINSSSANTIKLDNVIDAVGEIRPDGSQDQEDRKTERDETSPDEGDAGVIRDEADKSKSHVPLLESECFGLRRLEPDRGQKP